MGHRLLQNRVNYTFGSAADLLRLLTELKQPGLPRKDPELSKTLYQQRIKQRRRFFVRCMAREYSDMKYVWMKSATAVSSEQTSTVPFTVLGAILNCTMKRAGEEDHTLYAIARACPTLVP